MRTLPRYLSVLLLLILVTLAAAPTPQTAAEAVYPRSMAALGDSLSQANNACCRPGDQPAQSWSTGDGPGDGVASHYERLLQLGPAIRGNNANHSVSGAKASDLPRQAAAAAGHRPEYVTVLMGANDLCTSSLETMTPVEDFRASVTQALEILDRTEPRPRVFVSSIPSLYQLWHVLREDPAAQSAWSASGACQSMLAVSASEEARQEVVRRQEAFNAALAQSCAQYTSCRHDGGALYAHVPSPEDMSILDYFHPSLRGQSTLADITWTEAWEAR
ncbi:GDSL-type esterase/lipase family protein [Arthrobacter sp. AFG7.2]|uniref:GDSL-type esterase/lipase family protein n=1 Tax=Arthrobacter sp. AFG7.2 TaxID=1688693 RepID=UPI0016706D83|nr:GDSL-type esterase/lipase family protein [Arthrobacter sp. AFG7.2]